MILFIDSADYQKVSFALIPENGKTLKLKKKTIKVIKRGAEQTAPELAKFLGKSFFQSSKKPQEQLSSLVVVSGPGSFSGIRAGIALALGFAFAIKVPVYAVKKPDLPKNLANLASKEFSKKLKLVDKNFQPEYGTARIITPEKKHKLKQAPK